MELSLIWEYVIATILLSAIHGSIPNHWLPFVVIAKSKGWKTKELLFFVGVGSFFHSLSTILLGFFISYLGYYTTSNFEQWEKILPTFFMVFLGMIYIIMDHPQHEHADFIEKKITWLTLFLLFLSMFFSPCLEIEAIFFSVGKFGFTMVVWIGILYAVITFLSMIIFTYIFFVGLVRHFPKFLEIYEKKITGIILILLGVFMFFF